MNMLNPEQKELLFKLIRVKSFSKEVYKTEEALKLIQSFLRKNRINSRINFVKGFPYLIAGDLIKTKYLFLSHIDVVPGQNNLFLPTIKGDKIFGRGTLDMKGPLTAALFSFIKIYKLGRTDFSFVVTSDEEIGGFNGSAFLATKIAKSTKLAIILDSLSGENVVISQKAPFHIQIFHHGKSAHGSTPWKGINSAEKLTECCLEIVSAVSGKNNNSTTAAVTQIHSGQSTNMIPDEASAALDIRIRSRKELRAILTKIQKICQKHSCSFKKIDKPLFFETSRKSLYIKKWVQSFKKCNKIAPLLTVESGASDARFLSNRGIDVLITSAEGGGAHSENEWVSVRSLNRLQFALNEFCINL
jgi:succinyl-diaminopimelate desuccinylase